VLANASYDRHELKRTTGKGRSSGAATRLDVAFRIAQAAARQLFASDDPRRLPYEKPQRVETDAAKLVAARDLMVRWPGRVIGFAGDLTDAEASARRRSSARPRRVATLRCRARLGPFTPRPRARKT